MRVFQQPVKALFETFIDLSKDMLRHALDGEWEKVSAIEVKRQAVMQQCFAEPAIAEDREKIAAAIHEVLQLNQKISDLGEQSQQSLINSLQTHKQSKQACQAYLDNS
ncbi:MAG: flagellar protein FliT [Gammaproteobacteria bacterium]